MENFDIGSIAGLTAATVFVIQILKYISLGKLKTVIKPALAALFINLTTVGVSLLLSWASILLVDSPISAGAILSNGFTAGIAAAGGWEVIKNSWYSFIGEK